MKANQMRLCLILLFSIMVVCSGQTYFPDVPGSRTLVCDFHTHMVFSDGLVWPTVRVDEAKREGLDAIAISDHIEYQPHREDIPTNLNRSYEIALERAKKLNVLLIKAAEITRDTPPGHYNALFLSDANPLVTDAFLDVIEQANLQNAFVFWNHHTWKGEDRGQWTDVQTTMLQNGWLHGMEVANGGTYYPLAHQWCLEKGLTMLGNSDIHDPSIDYQYTPDKHRTLTLVFAKDRSVESIQQALRQGCTAVWYKNQLIGREEYLKPLFDQCITLSGPQQTEGRTEFVLNNQALIDLELERAGEAGGKTIHIPACSSVTVEAAAIGAWQVKNFLVGPGEGLMIDFSSTGETEQ